MIYVLLIYLVFQIAFDHWGQNTPLFWGIYYFAQWSFVASVAIIEYVKTKRLYFMFVSFPFIALALDEVYMYVNKSQPYEMASVPVLSFTLFVGVIFIFYEILSQWKRQ